jgi:predicted ATPase
MTDRLWHVELLGGLRAVRGSEVVLKFRTKNAALLLAMLSVRPGRAWGREELGERLWPDTDPTVQRERLRYDLSKLRSALGEDSIARGKHTMVAADPERVTSDVAAFDNALLRAVRTSNPLERVQPLREAISLYTGDLLPGFYDDWSIAERERLREGLFDALTRLILDLESIGRRDEALSCRRDTLTRFPDRLLPELEAASPTVAASSPAPEGRYFGREVERDALRTWVTEGTERLRTLVGPGGIGKTRLAREATAGTDALFVSFAEVFEADRIYETLHATLGLPPHQGDPYLPVVASLRGRDAPLLILDNLEQLIEEAAPRLTRLLRDVPRLRILATSRKRLNLPDERVVALNPLPDEASVALFLDRARLARPEFSQTVESLALVGEICGLLEGLPLAIELCAARTVVLGPRQILSQLQSRLRFLVNRRHAPVERHRSLRTALDWSFELLSEDLRRFFARLSVFRGGFTIEAAEAIASECVPSTVDALDDLHAHSLITVRFEENGEARYDILVVIREYAEEVLTGLGESESAQDQHLAYFEDHVASIEQVRSGAGKARFTAEINNYRQLRSIQIKRNDRMGLVRTLLKIGSGCFELNYWADFRAWLEVVSDKDADRDQKRVLWGLRAAYAQRRGDWSEAQRNWEMSLDDSVQREDWIDAGMSLNELTGLAIEQGNLERATEFLNRSRAISQAHRLTKCLAWARILEARLSSTQGNNLLAVSQAREAWKARDDIQSDLALHFYLAPIFRKGRAEEDARWHLKTGMALAAQMNMPYPLARLAEEATLFLLGRNDTQAASMAESIATDLHTMLGIQPRSEFSEHPQIGLSRNQEIVYNATAPDEWSERVTQLWQNIE